MLQNKSLDRSEVSFGVTVTNSVEITCYRCTSAVSESQKYYIRVEEDPEMRYCKISKEMSSLYFRVSCILPI
jgi:hypothetical protein